MITRSQRSHEILKGNDRRQFDCYQELLEVGNESVMVYVVGNDIEGWILELEDEFGNSTVWDDPFPSVEAGFKAAEEAIEKDGVHTFIQPTLKDELH